MSGSLLGIAIIYVKAGGDISLDELREVMLSDFTAKELDRMALDYASALTTDGGELVMSIDEAFEEICCDALGKINIFENTDRNSESYEKAAFCTPISAISQSFSAKRS